MTVQTATSPGVNDGLNEEFELFSIKKMDIRKYFNKHSLFFGQKKVNLQLN